MNKTIVKKMIGKPYKSKAVIDSDKDGLINIIDCKPYDKNKQGWVHDKWKDYKEKRTERIGEEKIVKEEVRKAAGEERRKQAVETAVFNERQSGERKRKYIKGGGFMGSLSRGFDSVSKGIGTISPPRRMTKAKTRVKTKKLLKGKPRKQSTKKRVTSGIPNMAEFKLNY